MQKHERINVNAQTKNKNHGEMGSYLQKSANHTHTYSLTPQNYCFHNASKQLNPTVIFTKSTLIPPFQKQHANRQTIHANLDLRLFGGFGQECPNIFLPNGGEFNGDKSHGIESAKQWWFVDDLPWEKVKQSLQPKQTKKKKTKAYTWLLVNSSPH